MKHTLPTALLGALLLGICTASAQNQELSAIISSPNGAPEFQGACSNIRTNGYSHVQHFEYFDSGVGAKEHTETTSGYTRRWDTSAYEYLFKEHYLHMREQTACLTTTTTDYYETHKQTYRYGRDPNGVTNLIIVPVGTTGSLPTMSMLYSIEIDYDTVIEKRLGFPDRAAIYSRPPHLETHALLMYQGQEMTVSHYADDSGGVHTEESNVEFFGATTRQKVRPTYWGPSAGYWTHRRVTVLGLDLPNPLLLMDPSHDIPHAGEYSPAAVFPLEYLTWYNGSNPDS